MSSPDEQGSAAITEPKSYVQLLESAVGTYFPAYGPILYRPREVLHDGLSLPLAAGGEIRSVPRPARFSCELDLFGQTICTSDCFADQAAAMEAVSRTAYHIIAEMARTVINSSDPIIDVVFKSVLDELSSFTPASKGTDENNEEASGEKERLLLRISDAIHGKSEPAIQAHINSAKMNEVSLKNPTAVLFEFARGRLDLEQPLFDHFTAHGMFGCRLVFSGKEYIAEAKYKKKSESKTEAARIACSDIFGDAVEFDGQASAPLQPVDPSKFSFGTSTDASLAKGNEGLVAQEPSSNLQPASTAAKEPFKRPLLSDGRKFVSAINELCQKLRVIAPSYSYSTVNTISSIYVCRVDGFLERSFESAAFNRKTDAKEDVAARIYNVMESEGLLEKVEADQHAHSRAKRGPPSTKEGTQRARFPSAHVPYIPPPMPFYPSQPPRGQHSEQLAAPPYFPLLYSQLGEGFPGQSAGQAPPFYPFPPFFVPPPFHGDGGHGAYRSMQSGAGYPPHPSFFNAQPPHSAGPRPPYKRQRSLHSHHSAGDGKPFQKQPS